MTNQHVTGHVYMVTFRVLNVNVNRRCVCHVSDAALLGRDLMSDTVFFDHRHSHPDVCEFEKKFTCLIFIFFHVRSN